MNMYDPNNDPYNYIRTADTRKRHYDLKTIAFRTNEIFVKNPRYPNIIIGSEGTIYNIMSRKKSPYSLSSNGYYTIKTFDSFLNKSVNVLVHRLVLSSFYPNPNENNLLVNHKDGNKLNNKLDNLEWVTNKENCQHAIATGLTKRKFTDEFVRSICELLNNGMTAKEVITYMGLENVDGIKSLLNSLIYRLSFHRILVDYPNIGPKNPRIYDGKQYQEFQVRRICELLEKEIDVTKVSNQYYSLYGEYIPPSFVNTIKSTIREGMTWWHIVSQYHIRKDHIVHHYSDDEIKSMCNMMINGASTNEIMQKLNIQDRTRGGFNQFLAYLRHNKIPEYRHITSSFFQPGAKLPRLRRDYK